jgi:hypothetical protein
MNARKESGEASAGDASWSGRRVANPVHVPFPVPTTVATRVMVTSEDGEGEKEEEAAGSASATVSTIVRDAPSDVDRSAVALLFPSPVLTLM